MFSKTSTFLYLYIFSHLFSFWNNFPLPHHLSTLFIYFLLFVFFIFSIPKPRCHKPYPPSKTFVNIRAVPSSVVFCSNAVLTTTPSSSMHFFSFFDVLPSAPSTTGMTVMLLMFHILLISLFRNVNYDTTFLIFIHYNNI